MTESENTSNIRYFEAYRRDPDIASESPVSIVTIFPSFDEYRAERMLIPPREHAEYIDRTFREAITASDPEILDLYDQYLPEVLVRGVQGLTGLYDAKIRGTELSVADIGNYYFNPQFRHEVNERNHNEQTQKTYFDAIAGELELDTTDVEVALYYVVQHEAYFEAIYLTAKGLKLYDDRIQ